MFLKEFFLFFSTLTLAKIQRARGWKQLKHEEVGKEARPLEKFCIFLIWLKIVSPESSAKIADEPFSSEGSG